VVAGSIPAAPTKNSGQWSVVSDQQSHCLSSMIFLILPTTDPRSLTTAFPVFARCRIQAFVGQHQALDWFAANDVRVDDLFYVGLGDVSVPDGVGIDDEVRAVLALIETARLVGPHFALEAALRELLLEYFLQFCLAGGIAAASGILGRPLVAAYENVFFELGHGVA
jgi:hypothetical protein